MSIINDALKKVQTNLNNNLTPTKNTMTTPPPENLQPNNFSQPNPPPQPSYDPGIGQPAAPWDIPAAQINKAPEPQAAPQVEAAKKQTAPRIEEKKSSRLTSVVVILFILFATVIFTLKKNEKLLAEHNVHWRLPDIIQKILPASQSFQKTQTQETLSTTAADKKNGLVVNAVMLKNGKHIALINDKIYTAGDSVNGMKILKINFQEMVVQDGENEKTIMVLK